VALWVFAYGSLMWRPGFAFEEVVSARLYGHHRDLCVYSVHYRGTVEHPGLVFGLDLGGSCRGRAFRVDPLMADEVIAYLDERELVTDVYRRAVRRIRIPGGIVPAVCYLARRDHPQYAGRLSLDERLELVRSAAGKTGRCRDYVLDTIDHLEEIGIRDRRLARIARRLRAGGASGDRAG
jgi:glutathione-specific gamma-glutamylcyclotransferase